MRKSGILILFCTFLLGSGLALAHPTPPVAPTTPAQEDQNLFWWNDRVFYEIFVRSFYDSDGDGIGDLQGVIQKLDYLNDGDPNSSTDLGVTGIWLMPIAESPSYHGYDVVDYYAIEQDYGTIEDFQALMAAAHERGIAVIVDLVLNHTSVEHPWFEEARDNPDSEYRDWYLWADEAPEVRGPWGQEVWHRGGDSNYFGIFWSGMPDLNYANPAVTAEMLNVTRFWLEDMGVDGFRLDAIKHLFEEGADMENVPATLDWFVEFHDYVHEIKPDALLVGEVWSTTDEVVAYIGERVDVAFEFDLAQAILNSPNQQNNRTLESTYETILTEYPRGQYATFITNHDQNRVMNSLLNNEDKAKVAATLLLTSPGVPFIYYGEEIGMVGTKPDEHIRTPMQWDSTEDTAGFTTGDRVWEGLANNYEENNVAAMDTDPNSLLNHYRALIHLRNELAALRTGATLRVESSDRKLFSYIRHDDENTLLVIVNLSNKAVTDYTLTLSDGLSPDLTSAAVLFGTGDATAPTITSIGGFENYAPLAEIPPYASLIIELGE